MTNPGSLASSHQQQAHGLAATHTPYTELSRSSSQYTDSIGLGSDDHSGSMFRPRGIVDSCIQIDRSDHWTRIA